jgi:HSP20 family protein
MTQLVKKNKSVFPLLAGEFFDSGRLFPSVFDLNDDIFNLNNGALMVPSANITETVNDFKIELAVPGLERKDLKVEVKDHVLSISAEKEESSEEKKKDYKRKEFSYQSFCRSFTLPENCVEDKIDAKYENGILNIALPKKEVSISKPVKEIKVS